jgi:hypothetical protein
MNLHCERCLGKEIEATHDIVNTKTGAYELSICDACLESVTKDNLIPAGYGAQKRILITGGDGVEYMARPDPPSDAPFDKVVAINAPRRKGKSKLVGGPKARAVQQGARNQIMGKMAFLREYQRGIISFSSSILCHCYENAARVTGDDGLESRLVLSRVVQACEEATKYFLSQYIEGMDLKAHMAAFKIGPSIVLSDMREALPPTPLSKETIEIVTNVGTTEAQVRVALHSEFQKGVVNFYSYLLSTCYTSIAPALLEDSVLARQTLGSLIKASGNYMHDILHLHMEALWLTPINPPTPVAA